MCRVICILGAWYMSSFVCHLGVNLWNTCLVVIALVIYICVDVIHSCSFNVFVHYWDAMMVCSCIDVIHFCSLCQGCSGLMFAAQFLSVTMSSNVSILLQFYHCCHHHCHLYYCNCQCCCHQHCHCCYCPPHQVS